MSLQPLLEAIAALSDSERADLLARLRELYPAEAPAPLRQMGLALDTGEWTEPPDYLLVFDGGSQGNPGVGYGSYALFDGNKPGRPERLSFPGSLTNNEAEYLTLIQGLRDLLKRLGQAAPTASLEVRGDSALVLQQVQGNWKAKDDRMRALRDEVRGLLHKFGRWRMVQQPREDSVRVLGH